MTTKHGGCAALMMVTVLASGCATIMNGRHQRVTVVSEPPGAEVVLDDEAAGVTPVTVDVSRFNPGTLQISKQGFVCEYRKIERMLSRWILGSVALVVLPATAQGDSTDPVIGVLGSLASTVGIDVLTGGAFKLENVIRIELEPVHGMGASTCDTDGMVEP